MTNQQQTPPARRVRPRPRMVAVSSLESLTPRSLRLTFSGAELDGFTTRGPAEHLKVMFPASGENRLELPEWGPAGPVLRPGQQMPPSRTYTPRYWRPEKHELVVDFMLHGESLASAWARNVHLGDVVAVSAQPGGAYAVDPDADSYLLAGDDSALPAIGTILEALPASARARVLIEVAGPEEEQALQSQASFDLTWIHTGDSGQTGKALEQALHQVELHSGRSRVWLGCEASIMRNIRRYLLDGRGMERGEIHTHGYWKLGAVNHPDHDVGEDI